MLCRKSKIIFKDHNMPLSWENVELRGFEPLTFCMPCLRFSSGGVSLDRVPARQGNGLVWQSLAASAVVWGRCHLVRHWQPASVTLSGALGVVDTDRESGSSTPTEK